MDNLPTWAGSDVAYSRAYKWTQALAAKAYKEAKIKKAWRLPEDVEDAIHALNIGDEETIKALNARYIDYWIK